MFVIQRRKTEKCCTKRCYTHCYDRAQMAAKFHGQTCHVNLNDSNSFKEKDKETDCQPIHLSNTGLFFFFGLQILFPDIHVGINLGMAHLIPELYF